MKKMTDKINRCPLCGDEDKSRKYGGYCKKCATLVANINTKRRSAPEDPSQRENYLIEKDRKAHEEAWIWHRLSWGYSTNDIVLEILKTRIRDTKEKLETKKCIGGKQHKTKLKVNRQDKLVAQMHILQTEAEKLLEMVESSPDPKVIERFYEQVHALHEAIAILETRFKEGAKR